MKTHLLGIDVGTYSSKAVLTDLAGQVLHTAVVPHGLSMPQPGHVEQDADLVWWADVCQLSRQVLAESGVRAVTMRPGILPLIDEALAEGHALAIATTTSPANVSALLSKAIGPQWRAQFQAVADASTAPLKKPHPQAYQQVLQCLGVDARDCMAFEDSENGLRAASAAGIPTIVTSNAFTLDHDFTGAIQCFPHLGEVHLADIKAVHRKIFD